MTAAHRVLAYLYLTRHLGLRYEAARAPYDENGLPVCGMSDSDWGVKHSTTGWLGVHVVAGQPTVSWSSNKQDSVALSSCEAELMAASDAAKEAIYLRRFTTELGLSPLSEPPLDLFVDNSAAIDVSYNPQHHGRLKHVDRRSFFVRECVEDRRL